MQVPGKSRVEYLESELQQLEHEFQTFVYLVSHDLQAPFRSIMSFSKLILENSEAQLDERSKKHFEMVVKGGQRGQSLVEGLLKYSRIHTLASPTVDVDMRIAVARAMQQLDAEILKSGAQIKVGDLPTVTGDNKQLYELWYYLLDNALKFRRENVAPVIHINAEKKRGNWVFSIQDNGIGIPPEYHEKVFEVFRRMHTDSEYPGIGMGLPLAERIVERHQGMIWMESEPDVGTKIYFILPVK